MIQSSRCRSRPRKNRRRKTNPKTNHLRSFKRESGIIHSHRETENYLKGTELMRAHSLHMAFLCLVILALSSIAIAQNKIKVDTNTFGAIEARHIGPAVTGGR